MATTPKKQKPRTPSSVWRRAAIGCARRDCGRCSIGCRICATPVLAEILARPRCCPGIQRTRQSMTGWIPSAIRQTGREARRRSADRRAGRMGKPRPGVIVQADELGDTTNSVLVCPMSSDVSDYHHLRPVVEPSAANGLRLRSQIITDKITALRRDRVRQVLGTSMTRHPSGSTVRCFWCLGWRVESRLLNDQLHFSCSGRGAASSRRCEASSGTLRRRAGTYGRS